MRDPYLYEDVDVLKNRANIKNKEILKQVEADITNLTMSAIYEQTYEKFDINTLCDIHRTVFGQIYDWAGEFRTIQMVKYEDVLGGDTVQYAYPKDIKKELLATMKEIDKLKRREGNDHDVVFRLVRIIASIWHIHPFREGNTRTVIVFAVLLARKLGFEVNHDLFKEHSKYVRNALVWGAQGIYSKYEYLEKIFFDAILHEHITGNIDAGDNSSKYEKIGDYKVKDYSERPHEYKG
ncbi:MAG: hypothetical protein E7385_07460 [Ruminococcaceae bacterium]|nr:hypothetical protein [Oscillospiraceae bacterium]